MFNQRQEAELITSIQGRGEIPLKFAYLGKGAINFDKEARTRAKTGGINMVETELLQRRIKNFLSTFSEIKKLNIIDIGCGNGYPVMPVIDELLKNNIDFRYVPIDISEEMLNISKKNLIKKYGKIEIKSFQLDFELGNFSDLMYELKHDGSTNLLLFLGSTLGNFSDKHRVLTNFRDSMMKDDYLIIGVELTNFSKINKILPYYQGKTSLDFIYFIPEKIGINRIDTRYEVSWNDKLNQVEVKMILKKDILVRIGSERFKLEKDEQILIGRSTKFSEWSITKILSDTGYRTELLTTNKERGYILSMIQPTRYSIS
jgi:uncharacterized SAM-dependent methyltransferase